ncbi:MAG: thioredoxin [Ruminococcus sp.]|nr:thioredoxin [Ruminococcus sp.]
MNVMEITSENFEAEVLNSEKTVIADFYADWCGPCRMMRPALDQIAAERDDVKVVAINVDDEDELAANYGISSIPCVIAFKNGKESDRSVGLVPRDAIERMI